MASAHTLSSDSITSEELKLAEEWLTEFYKKFMELYGNQLTMMCLISQVANVLHDRW